VICSRSLKHQKPSRFWKFVIYLALAVSVAIVVLWALPSIAQTLPPSGQSAATGIDKAWRQLFLGSPGNTGSTVFAVFARSLVGIGALGLGAQLSFVIAKMAGDDNNNLKGFLNTYLIQTMLPTVLVVALLANNGEIAGKSLYATKNIIFGIDKLTYDSFKQVTQVLQSDAVAEKAELDAIKAKSDSCLLIPDRIDAQPNPVFTQCISEIQDRIDAGIASGRIKDTSTIAQLTKSKEKIKAGNTIEFGSLISSIVAKSAIDFATGLIKSFIEGLGFVYLICIDIALLIISLSAPIVLIFSLFKFDVFLKWAPQILNMFIAKITYTLAVGISGILNSTSGLDLGAWGFSLLMGIGAPLTSVFVTIALSGSMGSMFERLSIGAATAGIKGLPAAAKGGANLIGGAARLGGAALTGGATTAARAAGSVASGASRVINTVRRAT
jgi:hypothetical protein